MGGLHPEELQNEVEPITLTPRTTGSGGGGFHVGARALGWCVRRAEPIFEYLPGRLTTRTCDTRSGRLTSGGHMVLLVHVGCCRWCFWMSMCG